MDFTGPCLIFYQMLTLMLTLDAIQSLDARSIYIAYMPIQPLIHRLSIPNLSINRVIAKAGILIHSILLQRGNSIQKVRYRAEPGARAGAAARQPVERQRRLVQHEADIPRRPLRRRQVRVGVEHSFQAISRVARVRTRPDLGNEAGAKGRYVWKLEGGVDGVVDGAWKAVGGVVAEVAQVERGEDAHDDAVVRHVHVEGLPRGEERGVAVVAGVDAGVAGGDEGAAQPRCELEHVPDALGAAGGGAEEVLVVHGEAVVVVEVVPFLLGEEGAEGGGAEGGGFVGAETLHPQHLCCGQVEVIGEGARQPRDGVLCIPRQIVVSSFGSESLVRTAHTEQFERKETHDCVTGQALGAARVLLKPFSSGMTTRV